MDDYQYDGRPRNPLRWLLALWRATRDPTNVDEVAIVQVGFARSRLLRRFARWEALAESLAADPEGASVLEARRPFGPVDLAHLEALPSGAFGRVFFEHCRRQNLNPNLVRLPRETPGELVMSLLYDTHDLWHVVTGWGTDDEGEVGLGAFYLAQMEIRLIVFVFVLLLLNSIFVAPARLRPRLDAFAAGYRMGQKAKPMLFTPWRDVWELPLSEVRERLGIRVEDVTGEGIRVAA